MPSPKLVPELLCTDLDASLAFYVGACGFRVRYARSEDRFAYLERDGADLMIEQLTPGQRRFVTAPLDAPFGRGMNLQIEVTDVDRLYERVRGGGSPIVLTLEDRWYRRDDLEVGNRQFVVADPDGYLLRFFSDIGDRALGA